MFYEFINDLGDIHGITLVALYADLRIYMGLVVDKADQEVLEKQAKIIYKDYIIEGNTYEMEDNQILKQLREGYTDGKIDRELDGELFQALYDFCIAGLEVYYTVFKSSDRFE